MTHHLFKVLKKPLWQLCGSVKSLQLNNIVMLLLLQVAKLCPNDEGAKTKYTECNKIVKQMDFARAIAGDKQKSIADTLDLDAMSALRFFHSIFDTIILYIVLKIVFSNRRQIRRSKTRKR